ncbi:helix-turn-helix domain-containing protein [Chitinophaga sp. S165]|uniref:winged helix-turn-helix transcriptional regulator n=1 Tax=Chitinophaga sp. S165 TaxID=2135462 RepID=UPI000D70CF52|nr:helix-turn-helix domain-containing protein [Chitinophaga sp. S165]PWV56324.1 HxlR family transcriptional regulator [Chitinophaga sp. S165]
MTKAKASSTLSQNKGIAETTCPITYVMNKIGGHWKCIILYYLISGPKRYSELKRSIPAITEKMLAEHLKQLKEDNLITKKVEQIMPPITIYSLTPSGEELGPVLMAMADWAIKDSEHFQNLRMQG